MVWRALKKLELLSVTPRATLTHLSCSPNFPRASYLNERTLTYEPIVNGGKTERSAILLSGNYFFVCLFWFEAVKFADKQNCTSKNKEDAGVRMMQLQGCVLYWQRCIHLCSLFC